MWLTAPVGGSRVHVIPLADLIEHSWSRDCVCGPRVDRMLNGAQQLVHHSLDGREATEPDRKVS